jgi:hypothetical protein
MSVVSTYACMHACMHDASKHACTYELTCVRVHVCIQGCTHFLTQNRMAADVHGNVGQTARRDLAHRDSCVWQGQ